MSQRASVAGSPAEGGVLEAGAAPQPPPDAAANDHDGSTDAATDAQAADGALAIVLDPSTVDAGLGGPPPALTANVTIHVAGDSTAAVFPATDPRVGWAAVLQPFFGTGVTVDDAAVSGASTKSFYDQGSWASLRAHVQPGDYVIVQFAHNDEKTNDPLRGTDPNTSYQYYLKTFVAETRQAGGYALLATSICRRYFAGTSAIGTHGAYTAALQAVAAETNTPVIDMEAMTLAWLNALGPTASVPMFAPSDNTHLSALGAPQVAAMAVVGFRTLGLPIASRLAPAVDASVSVDGAADAPGANDGPVE